MGRILLRGALLLDPESATAEGGSLLLEEGRIAARLAPRASVPPGAESVDLTGLAIAPGFLDLHHHGRVIFSDAADLGPALRHDALELVRHGTTAFLVTTVSLGPEPLATLVGRLAELIEGPVANRGACPIGIHLEGPWINPSAAGAHFAGAIRNFDPAEGRRLWAAAGGRIRMVTLAPELAGAEQLLEALARAAAVPALGHSLATAEQAAEAARRGARHVTHLFNAMGGVHHRAPGLAGAALADDRLTCDLICDGVHVDPVMLAAAARAKRDRLLLITDRLDPPPRCAAGPLAERELHEDGAVLRLAGGRLAGSRLTLERAVANARGMAGMTRLEAVAACTLRPARLLGIEAERGTLRPGARGDLTVLDAEDRVVQTWIGGLCAFTAESGG
jgi:N-acetylglucosamine-6-phosphate deacetylase